MNRLMGIILTVLVSVLGFCATTATAADNAPSIKYSEFLDAFNYTPESGGLLIENFHAAFLPEDTYTKSGTANMWAILRTASGTELCRLDFYVQKLATPYSEVSHYKLTGIEPGFLVNGMFMQIPNAGDYVLDFYLNSGKFHTFPFTITTYPAPDDFTPPLFQIDGDWRNWAYFHYDKADASKNLIFNVWLLNTGKADFQLVTPKVKVFNKNGGAYVFSARKRSVNLSPQWVLYDFSIATTAEPINNSIVASDLLSTDGDYVLKLFLDDQLYGEWNFSVAGGKFVLADRADRATADPLTFIEGGKDDFWVKKS